MNTRKSTLSAFSIIEVLIGIFVFSLGLVSIFALLTSSLKVNDYNSNSIIASNLAREQIELFRNIRDTNYKNLKIWNQYDLPSQPSPEDLLDVDKMLLPDNYYTLENKHSSGDVDVNPLGTSITEGPTQVTQMRGEYGLCLDGDNRYSYTCASGDTISPFMRYLYITEIEPDAYKITSKVIWYKRGYHEYEISTIVTDWRRI